MNRLGNVVPADVPAVLDAILAAKPEPFAPDDAPLCIPHWRGRMGMGGKEEQLELYQKHSITI